MKPSTSSNTIVLVLCLGLLPSCGGGSSPSGPSGGGPTPAPTATPTPEPTATPTPTPAPVGAACDGVPDGNGSGSSCSKRDPRFRRVIENAVETARAAPYQDPHSGETINMVREDGLVLAARAYVQSIIDQLDSEGLCAVFDGEEIQVRDTGADNENFDVITAEGFSWSNYVTTCSPALPIPAPPAVPTDKADPTCPLPPSAPYLCVKQTAALDGEAFAAQDALIALDQSRETPLVFDFSDRLGNTTYGYRIVDEQAYIDGMLEQLRGRGLCANFDGEEFNVKRNTNTFSENYDMTRRDFYAIRLYNATCRDASF